MLEIFFLIVPMNYDAVLLLYPWTYKWIHFNAELIFGNKQKSDQLNTVDIQGYFMLYQKCHDKHHIVLLTHYLNKYSMSCSITYQVVSQKIGKTFLYKIRLPFFIFKNFINVNNPMDFEKI